jgi:hypothetical protein
MIHVDAEEGEVVDDDGADTDFMLWEIMPLTNLDPVPLP